jgi:hypothetical protein
VSHRQTGGRALSWEGPDWTGKEATPSEGPPHTEPQRQHQHVSARSLLPTCADATMRSRIGQPGEPTPCFWTGPLIRRPLSSNGSLAPAEVRVQSPDALNDFLIT